MIKLVKSKDFYEAIVFAFVTVTIICAMVAVSHLVFGWLLIDAIMITALVLILFVGLVFGFIWVKGRLKDE